MLHNLKNIYDKLPKDKLKFLKYIPDRILFGKSYLKWKEKVSFDKSIIDKNLYDILSYAKKHTQYGKENIPKKFYIEESRKVLAELPLVSSYDIATNFEYYISDKFNKFNSYKTTTGGSGRNPTTILLSNESFGIEWSHMHNIWNLAGYDRVRDTKLTLRGKALKNNKLLEFNPIYNELIVDTFKVDRDNFKDLIKEIKKYNIKYIHGYPSLLKEYIEYFKYYNFVLNLNGVFLGSEGAAIQDKKQISEFFKCKVVHWYGQTEKVTLAVDEKMDGNFKIYTSYGYPRIIDGEIVATTFVNKAMPFINFKTGDGGEIFEDENYIYIKDIQSRRGKDFVYLNKDKKISTTAINLHSDIQNEILYYQIHQQDFGKVEIWLVKKETTKLKNEVLKQRFYNEIKEKLKDFELKIKIVNEKDLIRSHRGKFIFLVQELRDI